MKEEFVDIDESDSNKFEDINDILLIVKFEVVGDDDDNNDDEKRDMEKDVEESDVDVL